jgi:ornithine carbamoyltransferase
MAEGPRHFLDLDRVGAADLRRIFDLARDIKAGGAGDKPLTGKTLALIFEKPSTRTRVSFQVGMRQLGGDVVVIGGGDSHLGISETVADTARVLSRFVDIVVLRTDAPAKLDEMAEFATVPVINGLTDATHPCQLMADVMTFEEHRGPIAGRTVAWCGDGNNMAASWIQAAGRLQFSLRLACPAKFSPAPEIMDWAAAEGADVTLGEDVAEAVAGADCVVTDAWVSMGYPDAEERRRLLTPYRVDEGVMALAGAGALFMHCLPAHRGEEVTDAVIDGPHSVVWDEAENRLHAQKGILVWCLG